MKSQKKSLEIPLKSKARAVHLLTADFVSHWFVQQVREQMFSHSWAGMLMLGWIRG